jgi:hypothetical protein
MWFTNVLMTTLSPPANQNATGVALVSVSTEERDQTLGGAALPYRP